MQGLIDDGVVRDYAELARLGHVSRARVTQIMNLNLLAPDIQEEILFLPRARAVRRCQRGSETTRSESRGAKDYEHLARLVLGDAAPAPAAVELRPAARQPRAEPAPNQTTPPRIVRAQDLPELPAEAFRAPAND